MRFNAVPWGAARVGPAALARSPPINWRRGSVPVWALVSAPDLKLFELT